MTTTHLIVVLGDLHGWYPRLVYRTLKPIPVTISDDGQLLTLTVRGEECVGALVTPEGHPEPVVFLSSGLPSKSWTPTEGWAPADMPAGVVANVLETDVLAVCRQGDGLVAYSATVWLPRTYRPLERFALPVRDGATAHGAVDCRVLDAMPQQNEFGMPSSLIVGVDDLQLLTEAGWQAQGWVHVCAASWTELDELSLCVETSAVPFMGTSVLSHAVFHDLAGVNPEALLLLPRDIRDVLEVTLLAMPD